MAYFYDVNNLSVTGSQAVYKLKEVMKLAGWSTKSSSDGTTFNSTGDQITSGNSGADGLANNSAWFRIESPDLQRELCVQRGTTNGVWRVKYSYSAKFIGGTPGATQTPSAADQQFILGGGVEATPTFATWFTTDNAYRLHMAANNADGYGVFMFAATASGNSTSIPSGNFLYDPLLSGSFPIEDADPYCFYIGSGTFTTSDAATNSYSYLKKGLAGEGFVNMPWLLITGTGGSNLFPLSAGIDHINSFDNMMPLMYGRNSAATAPNGYKGMSRMVKYNPSTKYYPSLLSQNASRDLVCAGGLVLPWNGSKIIY